jgi:murein DD-endopeptidase MepM/ murein hydrolase activator NlpD
MNARTFAAFAFGFAAGALCLAVALWGAGRLSRPLLPLPREPVTLVQTQVLRGSADREAPVISGPRIAMPIAGVDVNTLKSNFAQTRGSHQHEALDIMSPRGTPVLAVAEGNVAKLFTSKRGGLTVYQFDNSQTWCYYYAHLDGYAPGVIQGTLLRKGDVLGYVGSTGDASPTAPHLHFAVFLLGPDRKWWQGTAVDPLPLLKAQ